MSANKDCWDKFEILVKFFGAVAVPGVVTWVGLEINHSLQSRAIDATYVEVAARLVASPDTASRKLGAEILEKFSPVEMPPDFQALLKKEGVAISRDYLEELETRPPAPKDPRVVERGARFLTFRVTDPSGGELLKGWLIRPSGQEMYVTRANTRDSVFTFASLEPSTAYDVVVWTLFSKTGVSSVPAKIDSVRTLPESTGPTK